MAAQSLAYFYRLKKMVEQQFWQNCPAYEASIHEWRGQEIAAFQDNLIEKVQGRVSEKWFYTHLKPLENQKLPRVDMLNLLSAYIGFEDWQDFKTQNKQTIQKEIEAVQPLKEVPLLTDVGEMEPSFSVPPSSLKTAAADILLPQQGMLFLKKNILKRVALMTGIGILLLGLVSISMGAFSPKKYQFCFESADTQQPITDVPIEILVLADGESPLRIMADAKGCVHFKKQKGRVEFVVQAAYYEADTIVRFLEKGQGNEVIPLKTDDYALMIHLFSTAKIEDWQKRRDQLNGMIADQAQIVQVSPTNRLGMELYNKTEFVNKLTMPLKSLKNIRVLETKYDGEGRILEMRFVQGE